MLSPLISQSTKPTLITIDEVLVGPQHEGILGLAFDPKFGSGSGLVNVVYTYDADAAEAEDAVDRRSKIIQLSYDTAAATLANPVELFAAPPPAMATMPAASSSARRHALLLQWRSFPGKLDFLAIDGPHR